MPVPCVPEMVSPSNDGDETWGGILSKDFGFRPRMHAREPRLWRAPRAFSIHRHPAATRRRPEMKNSGPGRMADPLGQ